MTTTTATAATTTPTPPPASSADPATTSVPPVLPAPPAPPAPDSAADPDADPDTQPDADTSQRRKDPAAEAAKYRRQLRDVEADRDAGTALLTATRRDTIEDVLATTHDLRRDGSESLLLHRPADLWDTLGASPDQFYDVDGKLDRGSLADFIATSTEGRAYLTRPPEALAPPVDPVTAAMTVLRRGGSPVSGEQSLGQAWSAALKPGSDAR